MDYEKENSYFGSIFDIFSLDDQSLKYQRIYQFKNLYDFQYQLEKLGKFLRTDYNPQNMENEYKRILSRHSSKARVMTVLDAYSALNSFKF